MAKNYKTNITFYYQAEDENDAIGTADAIAGQIEKTWDDIKVEAKVGTPHLDSVHD